MKNIWVSPNLTINIKIRIFNTTVKPVLLFGAETWRTTAATLKKIQIFINTCLTRVLWIRWPETISKRQLRKQTKQQPEDEIIQKRWRWTPPPKASDRYHTSSFDLEPTGKEKSRSHKKQLEPRSGG